MNLLTVRLGEASLTGILTEHARGYGSGSLGRWGVGTEKRQVSLGPGWTARPRLDDDLVWMGEPERMTHANPR